MSKGRVFMCREARSPHGSRLTILKRGGPSELRDAHRVKPGDLQEGRCGCTISVDGNQDRYARALVAFSAQSTTQSNCAAGVSLRLDEHHVGMLAAGTVVER